MRLAFVLAIVAMTTSGAVACRRGETQKATPSATAPPEPQLPSVTLTAKPLGLRSKLHRRRTTRLTHAGAPKTSAKPGERNDDLSDDYFLPKAIAESRIVIEIGETKSGSIDRLAMTYQKSSDLSESGSARFTKVSGNAFECRKEGNGVVVTAITMFPTPRRVDDESYRELVVPDCGDLLFGPTPLPVSRPIRIGDRVEISGGTELVSTPWAAAIPSHQRLRKALVGSKVESGYYTLVRVATVEGRERATFDVSLRLASGSGGGVVTFEGTSSFDTATALMVDATFRVPLADSGDPSLPQVAPVVRVDFEGKLERLL